MQRVASVSPFNRLVVKKAEGFARSQRLLKPGEFKQVFQKPQRLGDRNFSVLARPNNQGYPRLGLAIAKKHIKHAVQRNRIKRLIRESFRHHQDTLGGYDIVVMAKPDTAKQDNPTLRTSLERQWRRLKNDA